MTFPEFIAWAGTAEGINAIIGVVLSWVLDQWEVWKRLSPFGKRLWMFALSLVIPILATLLGILTGYMIGSTEVWWGAFQAGIFAFAGSQGKHLLTMSREKSG